MRVVVALPQLVFGRTGGFVGGYVNSVINLLEVMQYQCNLALVAGVFRQDARGEAELRTRLRSTRLHLLRMRAKPSTAAYFLEFLVRSSRACLAFRHVGPCVVFGHSGHAAYTFSTWWAARAAHAMAVHALYCPISEEFHERKTGALIRWLMQIGLRKVNYMVAISQNVADTIRRFSSKPIATEIIYPAIPDALAPDEPQSANPILQKDDRICVGFVGHHMPEKGFDLALQAVRSARDSKRSIRLLALMSGGHPGTASTDEIASMIARYGVGDLVEVIRGIRDMREFYTRIDVLLIPFRGTRGPSDFPMILLEALSLGVPVVSTSVGAVPEILREGENGFLAQDADAHSYTKAVERAITHLASAKEAITSCALKTAEDFRATKISAQTLESLSRLCRRNGD